ncbi:MAG: hypothetical protein U0K76_05580 [Dialister sp.]|nr:hypothetical protein [Dialister sp.]
MKPKENASYPYTAIDEFLRMPMECVQTDNGTEFTKRFTKASLDEHLTLFERKLKEYGNLPKIHSMISSITVYNICLTNQQFGKDTCQFYPLINKKGAAAYAATPKKSSN